MALVVKNPPAGLIPGSERSPEEYNGKRLQYSCLEHPTERGASWAMVHRLAESDGTKVTLCKKRAASITYIHTYKYTHTHTLLNSHVYTNLIA